jgi:hypothetical protein
VKRAVVGVVVGLFCGVVGCFALDWDYNKPGPTSSTGGSDGGMTGSTSSGSGGASEGGCGCPPDTMCTTHSCNNGACVSSPIPYGEIDGSAPQDAGACQVIACDGGGGTITLPDDDHMPPADPNPCINSYCAEGGVATDFVQAMVQAGTCDGGSACDGDGQCLTRASYPCNNDGGCLSGACDSCRGVCVVGPSDPCSSDDECSSLLCVSMVCATCNNAATCNAGYVCSYPQDGGIAGSCKIANYKTCAHSCECASNVCKNMKCAPCNLEPLDPCTAGNLVCIDGQGICG